MAGPGRWVTVRVLGPVDLSVAGTRVDVAPTELAFVVALALADGHEVTSESLADALWGEDAPPDAVARIGAVATGVRRAVTAAGADPDTVRCTASGYLLRTAEAPDLWMFDGLVTEARARTAAGWLEAAAEAYRAGLGLWRGPALAHLAAAFADIEAARLEELRLCALEERVDVDLKLSRHQELVDELAALVAAHPLRERLRAQLMLALYRCDRPDEALAAYDAAAAYLRRELGLDPGIRLRQMLLAVRSGHPSLQAPRRGTPAPRLRPPVAPRSEVQGSDRRRREDRSAASAAEARSPAAEG